MPQVQRLNVAAVFEDVKENFNLPPRLVPVNSDDGLLQGLSAAVGDQTPFNGFAPLGGLVSWAMMQ